MRDRVITDAKLWEGLVSNMGDIHPGSLVKVMNNYDRFWVRVTEVDRHTQKITGRVDNDIDPDIGYRLGNLIRFSSRSVIDIYNP